eukprot:TRINITY_DN1255_c0_g1_i15.p1 TRINITY_DN1255_c0_g1~~TRINITY_DN1255_c0_g1_i15.p1  ORF type:complete len:356 (+),score=58.75 TRINITY_DN1255_c0_g1_i15:71-1138(+)
MSLPIPPSTHPASATGHIPHDSIGPLPPHLADIGTPERQRSPVYGGSPLAGSPVLTSAAPVYHSSPVSHPVVTTSYSSPLHTSTAMRGGGDSIPPAHGKTYEQEVNEFLDQTSPARIREQSHTSLPPDSYMQKANHESITNESSPARTRSGSPYVPTSVPYQQSSTYVAPVPVPPVHYSQPRYDTMAGRSGGDSIPPVHGKTYEQEVNEFLDQTSPARIREQSHTSLPPDSYMQKANHESVTNESSPARQHSQSPGYQPSTTSYQPAYVAPVSPGGYVAPASPGGYVSQTEYVPIVTSSPGHGSPGRGDLGTVAPPGPGIPGDGESPRRIRAFGAPHSDPYAANQSVARSSVPRY